MIVIQCYYLVSKIYLNSLKFKCHKFNLNPIFSDLLESVEVQLADVVLESGILKK